MVRLNFNKRPGRCKVVPWAVIAYVGCVATLALLSCVHILSLFNESLTAANLALNTRGASHSLDIFTIESLESETNAFVTGQPEPQTGRATIREQIDKTAKIIEKLRKWAKRGGKFSNRSPWNRISERRRFVGLSKARSSFPRINVSSDVVRKRESHLSQLRSSHGAVRKKSPDVGGTPEEPSTSGDGEILHDMSGVSSGLEDLPDPTRDLDGVDLTKLLQSLTAQERRNWLLENLPRFKILQSDDISEAFPSRIRCFFDFPDDMVCGNSKFPSRHSIVTKNCSLDGTVEFDDNANHSRQSNQGEAHLLKYDRNSSSRSSECGRGIQPILSEEKAFNVVLGERPASMKKPLLQTKKCEIRVFMTWIYPVSVFGPREHLSLESVFKTYPKACVAILSRSMDTADGRQRLAPLLARGFWVVAASPNIPFLLQHTPAMQWLQDLKEGNIDPGEISLGQNLSDLLRLAALYKYGGVYLDSDVIVLRRFPNLHRVLGSQGFDKDRGTWTRINNAVMVFPKGDPILFTFIEEFAHTFDGNKWGHNGPHLITRVWRRLMNNTKYECSILTPAAFYPFDWKHVSDFFELPKSWFKRLQCTSHLETITKESYAIRLWNKRTREIAVEKGSILDTVFRRQCVVCNEGLLRLALQPQVAYGKFIFDQRD